MSKKIILWVAVGTVVSIMLFALVYGLFDIHDTKPFPIDPESAIFIASALLVLSLRVLLIRVPLPSPLAVLVAWLCASGEPCCFSRCESAPDPFLSPPLTLLSLRI